MRSVFIEFVDGKYVIYLNKNGQLARKHFGIVLSTRVAFVIRHWLERGVFCSPDGSMTEELSE